MRGGQIDPRHAEMTPMRISIMPEFLLQIGTYRGIVEDERGGCVNGWCAGVCGRIDILPSVEL